MKTVLTVLQWGKNLLPYLARENLTSQGLNFGAASLRRMQNQHASAQKCCLCFPCNSAGFVCRLPFVTVVCLFSDFQHTSKQYCTIFHFILTLEGKAPQYVSLGFILVIHGLKVTGSEPGRWEGGRCGLSRETWRWMFLGFESSWNLRWLRIFSYLLINHLHVLFCGLSFLILCLYFYKVVWLHLRWVLCGRWS